MTIVENIGSPAAHLHPQRRALLPRNPTPWAPQEEPSTPPPAVQRLLQQVGGSSYRTYQPFQVVAPLMTPDSTHETVQQFSNFEPASTASKTPLLLTQLCRNVLLSHHGLRNLRQVLSFVRAPKCLVKFLTSLNAKECVVRSSAPLLDIFSEPFFHRAVTWRVVCCLDQQHYLATYAHTDQTVLQECRWLSPVADAIQDSEWLWLNHPHIMRVWGTVLDDVTGNTFYLLDTPIATLDQIQNHLTLWSIRVPEDVIWSVLLSISSALCHCAVKGLSYQSVHLTNVFLVNSGIVLENGLTRKKRMDACKCLNTNQSHSPESCLVHQIGEILFALMTCHLRVTWRKCPESPGVRYRQTLQLLRQQYSTTLLRLVTRALNGGLSSDCSNGRRRSQGLNVDRTLYDRQWENKTKTPKNSVDFTAVNGLDAKYEQLDYSNIKDSSVKPKYRLPYKKSKEKGHRKNVHYKTPAKIRDAKENMDVKRSTVNDELKTNSRVKTVSENKYLSLSEIVILAEEQVFGLNTDKKSVQEILQLCPQKLVKLSLSHQN